jgi:hypothetical protein
MSYRNEDICLEEYTLEQAKSRFKHFCNHCKRLSSTKFCKRKHRIKDIIVNMPDGREKLFLVRKKGGCEYFL